MGAEEPKFSPALEFDPVLEFMLGEKEEGSKVVLFSGVEGGKLTGVRGRVKELRLGGAGDKGGVADGPNVKSGRPNGRP